MYSIDYRCLFNCYTAAKYTTTDEVKRTNLRQYLWSIEYSFHNYSWSAVLAYLTIRLDVAAEAGTGRDEANRTSTIVYGSFPKPLLAEVAE